MTPFRPWGTRTNRTSQGHRADGHRVVWQAASLALTYPDEALLARGPLLRSALSESAPDRLADFAPLLDAWHASPLSALQSEYVDVFDLSRRRALHLSYWTDGDTRRRGEVLAAVKQRYRACGFLVDLAGELPDHLPLVLEYAAVADSIADLGDVEIQDIAFHGELDDVGESWPSMTVYFHPSEEPSREQTLVRSSQSNLRCKSQFSAATVNQPQVRYPT